jgi:hypothetical protein
MSGIVATADITDKVSGKKVARNIRKIAGLSPIWNHNIAKGIQARGDKERKKLSTGRMAVFQFRFLPSQSPIGMARHADDKNPMATLHKEATISFNKRAVESSSPKLFTTDRGEGNAYSGKTFKEEITCQQTKINRIASGASQFLCIILRGFFG